jgi:hypothetical protein
MKNSTQKNIKGLSIAILLFAGLYRMAYLTAKDSKLAI